jgi:hypothetical protein
VALVWEYMDRAYQRQDVFLHDLMKPVLAHKEIGEKNYWALEEYLDSSSAPSTSPRKPGCCQLSCT